MDCPVCKGAAEALVSANDNVKLVRCDGCGTFNISTLAETALARMDDHHRLQELRYAQTNALAGRFPYIHGVA